MNRTGVSWVVNPDGTPGFAWNPLVGCSHASAGCAHCWAERMASTRLAHLPEYAGLTRAGDWTGESRFLPDRLAEPLRRRKPSSIAVCLMGDLFHPKVTNEQIAAVYGVMAACPQHQFHVLTKRAKRRREWHEWIVRHAARKERYGSLPSYWQVPHEIAYWAEALGMTRPVTKEPIAQAKSWPLPRVVEGVSVEDQSTADKRIPELLQTPAAVRGLSVEPLLGKIDLSEWIESIDHCDRCNAENPPQVEDRCPKCGKGGTLCSTVGFAEAERYRTGERWSPESAAGRADVDGTTPRIDWVIVGCESGPKARPMDHAWAAGIWRQCLAASVPYFFKQEMVDGKLCHEPTLEGRTWRELPRWDAG